MDQDFAEMFREYLIQATTWLPVEQRKGAHWVMSDEWYLEVLALTDSCGYPLLHFPHRPTGDLYVYGYPITIREGAGAPILEAADGEDIA